LPLARIRRNSLVAHLHYMNKHKQTRHEPCHGTVLPMHALADVMWKEKLLLIKRKRIYRCCNNATDDAVIFFAGGKKKVTREIGFLFAHLYMN